ncbi:hypothetical protein NC653_029840 [Populus alba x Populus x berolinensis]|uniref:Uncharacterized protein n=1 Tax=Populus alba x Populus x berolinensis TaxID=444605 RepID=A0AAD6M3D6_9ROSI|nr:hypothetical protein NC653_029840 [Populus alba x Populus x berolinensis]
MENKYLHTKRIVVLLSLLPPYTGDINHHSPRWEIAGCKASTEKKDGLLSHGGGMRFWWFWMAKMRGMGLC